MRKKKIIMMLALLTTATAWADDVNLTEDTGETAGTAARWYVNMPATGTNTLTLTAASVTTFKVYDNGGKGGGDNNAAGNYSNDYSGYLTLTAPEGYVLQLSGNITTEKYNDKLTVYDSNGTSGTKLLDAVSSSSSGTQTAIQTVASTGQSMTLYFCSDRGYNCAGLDLTVTLVNPNIEYDITINNPATGGTVAASVSGTTVTTAKWNDAVTLTATPTDGYLLSDLSVKDASNNAVAVTWDGSFSNTATFTMPTSAVTVTPTFTNTLTADGGLYINMPKTHYKTVTIPTGVQSFKVYDDGGKDGNYSNSYYVYFTLTAPEDYVLQLSGNITTGAWDNLTVYDGDGTNGTKLLNAVSSTSDGTATAIQTVASTGQSMTLDFSSDNSGNYAGLDLTVTLISPSTESDITVNTATGGSVASDKSKAKWNDAVTLTATPESGYLLSDLSVKDASNNAVALEWNVWTNTATFSMSRSAVTVTPTFTNDLTSLSVNMPTTGTKSATIPTGVQSFKVYDDGGKDGNYSYFCDGTLTLTAPTGYVLQLSGNITTENDYDKLTVYDNSAASGTKLLDAESSTSVGTQTAIETVYSSGQSMTLYFYSDNSRNYAGLDLTVTLVKQVTLADNADNASAISEANNQLASVTLSGRTLYKDGAWNTICLPFSVGNFTGTPLEGATVKTLASTGFSGGTLTMTFSEDVTSIEAGKPYIVMWTKPDGYTVDGGYDISEPMFNGVTISNATANVSTDYVDFVGTYSPVSIYTDEKTNLYLGADNTLYYPTDDGFKVNACRGYFQLKKGLTAGEITSGAIELNFGEDEATGIISIENGKLKIENDADTWYSLDGRKLDGKPTQRGIYINNGKKTIIK